MKLSKSNFSEWYNTVVRKIVDDRYGIKGVVVLNHWGTFIINKIYEKLKKEMEKRGHKQVIFPIMIPERNFQKEKEHVEGFSPEVFWVTEAGKTKLEERLALRPTSEAAIYPMYSLWINGKKDLPMKLYQIGPIFRYETKATKPLIRGREFYWLESHDAFSKEKEAREQIVEDMEVMRELMRSLKLPFKYFKRPDWDKFAGAVESHACDTILPDGRRLQVATTHYLGQNFSKAYDIKFKDSDGKSKYVYQTCFGPGVYRLLAALISIHGDEYGMVLPFEYSPVQIVIIPIGVDAKDIKEEIEKMGYRVFLDDSEETPGEKFYKWEELGVPIRIEYGKKEKEEGYLTLFRRDKRERIKIRDLSEIKKIAKEIDDYLEKRAIEYFDSMIVCVKEKEEINRVKNKVIKFHACEKCSRKIEEYGLDLFGDSGEKEKGKCIFCGKETNLIQYAGKSY